MALHLGKIQVKQGKWTPSCTTEWNLIDNQLKYPAIRRILEYADKRMLTTLIASGVTSQYALGYQKTQIGEIPQDKVIGNNSYQFDIMGRIQQASEINYQVGGTQPDGTFQLSMKDDYLVPGMNCLFHGQNFQARVMGMPQGSSGSYIYTFKAPDGTLFAWATHVAPQQGPKTAFGGYTSYSEKSLRGYGRFHTPDTFMQHMTISRKGFGVSGGAGSDVLWIEYENDNGATSKGWYYVQQQQARVQRMMEDETMYWDGISSMKDPTTGKLLSYSTLGNDPETGLPITQGDGILRQIEGSNVSFGSAQDGTQTINDIIDMMTVLEKKCNMVSGKEWVCVTGTDGYATAQRELKDYAYSALGMRSNIDMEGNTEIGGKTIDVGYTFRSFNINGNKVTFVKHPEWDNEQKYTERGRNGKLLRSGMMVFLDLSTENGRRNLEILTKGGNGFSRREVSAEINGLTGKTGSPVYTSEDALRYEVLSEKMIVMYNTVSSGIIYMTP